MSDTPKADEIINLAANSLRFSTTCAIRDLERELNEWTSRFEQGPGWVSATLNELAVITKERNDLLKEVEELSALIKEAKKDSHEMRNRAMLAEAKLEIIELKEKQ